MRVISEVQVEEMIQVLWGCFPVPQNPMVLGQLGMM